MRKIALAAALALLPTLAFASGHGHGGAGSIACLSMASSVEKDAEAQAPRMTPEQRQKVEDLLQVAKMKCELDGNTGEMALNDVRDELAKAGGH